MAVTHLLKAQAAVVEIGSMRSTKASRLERIGEEGLESPSSPNCLLDEKGGELEVVVHDVRSVRSRCVRLAGRDSVQLLIAEKVSRAGNSYRRQHRGSRKQGT
jgi:hypothetical protein